MTANQYAMLCADQVLNGQSRRAYVLIAIEDEKGHLVIHEALKRPDIDQSKVHAKMPFVDKGELQLAVLG